MCVSLLSVEKHYIHVSLWVGLHFGAHASQIIYSPMTVSNISLSFMHSCDCVPQESPGGSNPIGLSFLNIKTQKTRANCSENLSGS